MDRENKMVDEILKDYRLFYFELDKYQGRELGFGACKNYLKKSIQKAIKKDREMIIEEIKKDKHSNNDAEKDAHCAGYNDAIDNFIFILNNKFN